MKRITLILSLALALTQPVVAQQVFVELDEDFPFWIDKTTTTNKDLVVFSPKSTIGYRQATFRVSTWNGLFWTDLPSISASNVFYGVENNLVVSSHQNKIVIAGSYYANGEQIKGIAQWNGSAWETLGGGINTSRLIHDEFSIHDVASYDGELFVAGDFTLAGGLPVMNFAKFSSGVWSDIPTGLGKINHLQTLGSALYAAGEFSLIDGAVCNNLAVRESGKWSAVPHSFSGDIKGLAADGTDLIAVTNDGFYRYQNNVWTSIGAKVDVLHVDDVLSYNGRVYATGLFIQNGVDSVRLIALTDTDLTVYLKDNEITSNISKKVLLNEVGNTLYLSGSFTKLKGKEYNHVAAFRPGNSVLQGQVYMDKNANCVFDQDDVPKANAIVSLNNGESYTSTDEEGRYTLFVQNNKTSTIQIFPANNEVPLCNGAERTVVTSGKDSLLVEDFALKLNQMTPIRLSYSGSSGYKVKHGYGAHYLLDCGSEDKAKFPMEVRLTYDSRLSEFKSSVTPTHKSEGYAMWVIDKNTTIEVGFVVSPYKIEMGETIDFSATAKPKNTSSAEEDHLTQTVVSAYDPNDKQCDKDELSAREEQLEYMVRFQNLGTDNARDIHIVDTIDPGIPIEFIQIHKNSHYERYATSYKVRGHAIVWSFKDIELPPKMEVGDEKSSGFIAYQCGMSEELKVGDVFTNKAYIYFDFQPPVITNTTESVVVDDKKHIAGLTEDFVVYPNPSSGQLQIQSKHLSISSITVFSSDGKLVYESNIAEPSLHSEIQLRHLPAGVYFVSLGHALGMKTIPVVLSSVR